MTLKKCDPAEFAIGDHVNHPAAGDGCFPAGTGTVTEVTPLNSCDGYVYRVRCDMTGNVLPVAFEEAELSAIPVCK